MQLRRASFELLRQVLSLLLLLTVAASTAFAANTIHIPADQPTIQAGINAAAPGDTVLVAPGTYYENIDFKGKAITVISSDGAAKTIIDGGGLGSVVSFVHSELRSSIIAGFTIRNAGPGTGNGASAGILAGDASAPTILNNVVTSNVCNGIDLQFSAALLMGNQISQTIFQQVCGLGGGTGLFIGGTYYIVGPGSQPTLSPTVIGNTIEQNLHGNLYDGGGILIYAGGSPIIENNIIRNNSTTGNGGAISMVNTDNLVLVQNLIYGNSAGSGGGGIDLLPPGDSLGPFFGIIANNTFADNAVSTTNDSASQVYLEGNLGQYVFINNIVVGNATTPASACGTTYNYLSLTPLVIDHNDIYNAQGPAYGGACPDQTGTYGNISADPLFNNPASGDFHLRPGSPAIDVGNNSVLTLLQAGDTSLTNDISGNNPRLQDATGKSYPIIDMGAYESVGPQDANATLLTLTPSAYEVVGGASITLTAKLISANGIPTGAITFFEDGNQLGSSIIGSSGTATLPASALVPGVHAFLATYPGQGSFTPATSVKFFVLVDKYPTTLNLVSSINPALLGQSITFTATISAPDNAILGPIALTDGGTPLATLTPDSNGIATYTTSTLTIGTHGIHAFYNGDATHTSQSGFVNQQVVNGYPTPTTLTSSLNPAGIGQAITFTATTTFGSNGSTTPAASTMTFMDGNTTLSVQPLTAQSNTTAVTTFTTSALTIGIHNINVVLSTPNGFASAATLNQVVNGLPTTTTLTASPNPANALQTVTLTASVTSTSGGLTGNITFYDGAISIGTVPTAGVPANSFTTSATLFTTKLAAGTHTITAVYSGDTTNSSSTSNPVTEIIRPLPTSTILTINPTPAEAFQSFTIIAQVNSLTSTPLSAQPCAPNCTVTITIGGLPSNIPSTASFPVLANGTVTARYAFAAGTYTFNATFSGSSTFAASTAIPAQQTVIPATTVLYLAATPHLAIQHQTVTFTATLAAPVSTEIPSGTLTFLDGTTPLGTASFNANTLANSTTATISTNALAPGTHSITAIYTGDLNFTPATSAPIIVTIKPPDFTLTTANPSLTIPTQHHASIEVQIAAVGSLVDTIHLTCQNLPIYASCRFSNPDVPVNLGPTVAETVNTATTLTIDTDEVPYYASSSTTPIPGIRATYPTTLALICPAGLLGLLALRRRKLPRRLLILAITTTISILALNGCSGHLPGSAPPGTYTITVTGNATTTGLTHTTTFTLIVTPLPK